MLRLLLSLIALYFIYQFPQAKASPEGDLVSAAKNGSNLIDKLEPMQMKEGSTTSNTKKVEPSPEPITVYEDQEDEAELLPKGDVDVLLTIAVPHTKRPAVEAKAYPYPPKLPKISTTALPEEDEAIAGLLIAYGYLTRSPADEPYPAGGWRWQYAFRKAVKKSHLSLPHSIVEHYRWSKNMVPYIKPEILKINAFEDQRVAQYKVEEAYFKEQHDILMHDATRRGLEPIPIEKVLNSSRKKIGTDLKVKLPQAKWWFIVTYKVPGLTYHWRIIKDYTNQKPDRIILNEGNAFSIEGGW
ncbi:MAG: hypothetical protein K8F91_23810 [Candidatus Obscuribacterales bacterium]|nr:hypothetical protein [Candidatus Obscuribacterales bacterium]